MSEENNIENNDSVKTVENEEANESVEEMKKRIAELEEVAKNKAIEARLAKKEQEKSSDPNTQLAERLARIELKEHGLKEDEIELVKAKAEKLNLDPVNMVQEGLAEGILAQHRKAKADEAANPKGQSRASVNTRDSVDYWIAKGELPEDVELKRKVVRKKREIAKKAQMFNY